MNLILIKGRKGIFVFVFLLSLFLFPLVNALVGVDVNPPRDITIILTGNLTTLEQLLDVNIPSPNNNEVLTFNSSSGLWESQSSAAVSDTNETTRFNFLVSNDCSAGDLVIGIQANGTVLCAADVSGGGNPFDQVLNITSNVTFNRLNLTGGWGNVTITESQISNLVHTSSVNIFDQVLNTTSNVTFNNLTINSTLGIGIIAANDIPLHIIANVNNDIAVRLQENLQSGTDGIDLNVDGNANLIFTDRSAELMIIQNSGEAVDFAQYIRHLSDINTFIRFTTPDQIEFEAGAVKFLTLNETDQDISIFNQDANDIDFRIESANFTHLFFLEASTDRIGINTSTPQNLFNVDGDINFTGLIYGNGSQLTDLPGSTNIFDQILNTTSNVTFFQLNVTDSVGTNLIPFTDSLFDLGTNTIRWALGFFDTLVTTTLNTTNINTAGINATDWSNVSITESQISDLIHNGGVNIFDQVLNTTSNVTFNNVTIDTNLGIGTIGIDGVPLHIITDINTDASIRLEESSGGGEWMELQFTNEGDLLFLDHSGVVPLAIDDGGTLVEIRQDLGHRDDPNTLMRFNIDQIFFQAGGLEFLTLTEVAQDIIVFNDNSLDIDFRIESANFTHLFFLEASTDRIGINTSTPQNLFNVDGDINFTGLIYGNGSQLTDLPGSSGNPFDQVLNITSNVTFNRLNLTGGWGNVTITESQISDLFHNGTIDTNETARFLNLTTNDCSAGELVIGVQDNGTVLCASDADSGAINIFDQILNTTSNVTFFQLNVTDSVGTNLIPFTDSLFDIGATATRWLNGFFDTLFSTSVNTTLLNATEAFITTFHTLENDFRFNFFDDGSDLTFNVSNGGGDFMINQENSMIKLINSPVAGNDFKVFQVFSQEAGDQTEFTITKSGKGHTSYFVRSLALVGNGTSIPTAFNCSTFSDIIDCDSDLTGPDFYVLDDIEANGTIFTNEFFVSITNNWSNVSITESQISDLIHSDATWISNWSAYNTTWSSITNSSYLINTGDTMIGDLNMSANNITTVDCIVFENGGQICQS